MSLHWPEVMQQNQRETPTNTARQQFGNRKQDHQNEWYKLLLLNRNLQLDSFNFMYLCDFFENAGKITLFDACDYKLILNGTQF
jgi:hypothetical protein